MFSLNGFTPLRHQNLLQIVSFRKETRNSLRADAALDPPKLQIFDHLFGGHIFAAFGSGVKLSKGLHLVRPDPQLITFSLGKPRLIPDTDFLLLLHHVLHRPLERRQVAGVILHRQILEHIRHIDRLSLSCRRKQLE